MDQQVPSFFDVSKLSSSSRRKYQSYFSIVCEDGQLDKKIREHFDNDLKVQANEVIEKFLELKKQDKQKRRQRNARAPLNS